MGVSPLGYKSLPVWETEEAGQTAQRQAFSKLKETHLLVNLIHGRKRIHVFQEYIDLDKFVPRRSSSLEDITQVFYALSLQNDDI